MDLWLSLPIMMTWFSQQSRVLTLQVI